MITKLFPRCLIGLAFALATVASASAEVVRATITSRVDVDFGYEKIVGRVFFAVDPKNPQNVLIADIDKAPRNTEGLVEFSSDLYILRPKAGGNDTVIIDVVNRGRLTMLNGFNRAGLAGTELGDGMLMKRGFTIVAVGWEFDVPSRPDAIRIEVPPASENGRPVQPIVSGQFTPDKADRSFTVGDLVGYTPADPLVRTRRSACARRCLEHPQIVERGTWTLAATLCEHCTPFEAGRSTSCVSRLECTVSALDLPLCATSQPGSSTSVVPPPARNTSIVRLVAERPVPPDVPLPRLQHRRARTAGVRRRHGAHCWCRTDRCQ